MATRPTQAPATDSAAVLRMQDLDLKGRRVLVERQLTERGEALDGLVHAGVTGASGSRPGPF